MPTDTEQNEQQLALNVFAVSAALVGVCLTSIGILRLLSAQASTRTICDDLLAVDAVVFVLACGFAFASFRVREGGVRRRLRLLMDVFFLTGLAGMTAICALVAYTIL